MLQHQGTPRTQASLFFFASQQLPRGSHTAFSMALVHSIRAGASAVSRSAASAEAASTLAFATWACSSRLASGPGRTFAASPWEAPSLIPLGSSLTEDQENDKPMAPCAAYYGSLHYSQDPFASQVSVTAPRQACAFPGSFPWAVAAALRQADGSVAPLSWQPEASLSQGLDSARQSATALVRGQAHALTSSPWQSRGHAVRLLSAPAPDASGRRTATGQPQTTPSPGGAAKVSKGAAPVSTSATAEDLAEECDEAVEDLGEVRKRVKAAKEAMRKGKGVIRASWLVVTAVLGRAWGAVASLRVLMTWSRQDWMNTFSRWWSVIKHEANHYWVRRWHAQVFYAPAPQALLSAAALKSCTGLPLPFVNLACFECSTGASQGGPCSVWACPVHSSPFRSLQALCLLAPARGLVLHFPVLWHWCTGDAGTGF